MPDLSHLAPALDVATPEATELIERYARAHDINDPAVLDTATRQLAGWLESSRGALQWVPTSSGGRANAAFAPELGALLETWLVDDDELTPLPGAATSTDLLDFVRETLLHSDLTGPLSSLDGAGVWERRLASEPARCEKEMIVGLQRLLDNLSVRLTALGATVERAHDRVATVAWAQDRRIVLTSGHPDPTTIHNSMDGARRTLGWTERLLVFAPVAGPSSMFHAFRPGLTKRDNTLVVRMQLRDAEPLLHSLWNESAFAELIETGFWIGDTIDVPTIQFLLSAQYWRHTDAGLAVPMVSDAIAILSRDTRQPYSVALAGGERVIATSSREEPAILTYHHAGNGWECTLAEDRAVHVLIGGQHPQMARSVAHWSTRLLRAAPGGAGLVTIEIASDVEVKNGLATVSENAGFAPLSYTFDPATRAAQIEVGSPVLLALGEDRDGERHLVNTVANVLASAGLLDGSDTAKLVDEVRPLGGPQHYNVSTRDSVSRIEHAAMPGPAWPRSERARATAAELMYAHAESDSADDRVAAGFALIDAALGQFDRTQLVRILIDALGRCTATEFHNERTSFDYVGLYGEDNGRHRYLEQEPQRVLTAMALRGLLELSQCAPTGGALHPRMGDVIDLVELMGVLIDTGSQEDVRRANVQMKLNPSSDVIQSAMIGSIERWVGSGARASQAFNVEEAPALTARDTQDLNASWLADCGLTFSDIVELLVKLIAVDLPPHEEYRRIAVEALRAELGWTEATWDAATTLLALPQRAERVMPDVSPLQFFPWHQRRKWSLLRRPILQDEGYVIVGRRTVAAALRIFVHDVGTGRRFVGPKSEKVASQISNRRGDVFAKQVLALVKPHTDFAQANVKTVHRTRLKVDGRDIGDVDVLARQGDTVFALEAKSFAPGKSPNTILDEARKLHDPDDPKGKSAIAKHLRLVEWLEEHRADLAAHVGIEQALMRLVAAVVLPGSSIPTQITDFDTPLPVIGVDALLAWMREQSA